MRINKTLLESARMNPTKETRQQNIEDLCKSIDDGILVLPLYQRDLSWTLQKSVDLLNYQLSGKAPVSAISFNIINKPEDAIPQISFITREIVPLRSGLNSVIDGQQRISTNYKAYNGDKEFESIVLDLQKGKFLIVKEGEQPKKHQIPVGVIYNRDMGLLQKYLASHKPLNNMDVQAATLAVRSKFVSYNYTINQAKDLTEDEQINWFEVLNNAGSRVTAIQMRLAKLKIHNIDIYRDYTQVYVEKIKEHGYDDVFLAQTTNVSYPISALNPAYESIVGQPHSLNYCPMASDCKENAICSLEAEDIRRAFNMTLTALDKALSFIDEHELKLPDRIDYINYLLGYFVFYPQELTEAEEAHLISWYNSTNFANTSNTERRNSFNRLLQKI